MCIYEKINFFLCSLQDHQTDGKRSFSPVEKKSHWSNMCCRLYSHLPWLQYILPKELLKSLRNIWHGSSGTLIMINTSIIRILRITYICCTDEDVEAWETWKALQCHLLARGGGTLELGILYELHSSKPSIYCSRKHSTFKDNWTRKETLATLLHSQI